MQNLALIFLSLALGLTGQFTLKIGMNQIGKIDLISLSAIAKSLCGIMCSNSIRASSLHNQICRNEGFGMIPRLRRACSQAQSGAIHRGGTPGGPKH